MINRRSDLSHAVPAIPTTTGPIAPVERDGTNVKTGNHTASISAEATEHVDDDVCLLRSPVRYNVEIVGWDYNDHGDEHDVVFAVTDDHGRRQRVRFGMTELELSSGQLDHFIATVLGRRFVKPAGIETHFWRGMLMNQLVGRRVVLEVVTTHRGVPIVVDWESVPQEPLGGKALTTSAGP